MFVVQRTSERYILPLSPLMRRIYALSSYWLL